MTSYAPSLIAKARAELELRERQKARALAELSKYANYRDDPVGFGMDVLGEQFTDDIVAVMNSVRDNPVTIAKSANATGKTHCAARIAIWFAKVFAGAEVYTAAAPPENNLKFLLWGEIDSVTLGHEHLFEGAQLSSMRIKDASSMITGVTIPASGKPAEREAKFSGKHAPYLLFILDEADAIPPEVFRGIESCMSGGHARLLCMFNPRHESGVLERMERNGEANVVQLTAFNHPNVKTGKDLIPGAVDRNTTVRRINVWSRPLGEQETFDSECFEVPDFLVGSEATALNGRDTYPPLPAGRRKITESAFSYMVMAEYPAQGTNQLINRADVYAAITRWQNYVLEHGEWPASSVRPMLAGDIAEMGNDSNVATLRWGDFVQMLPEWSGVDPVETGDRFARLYDDHNAYVAYIDGTGVGAGVAPHMQRKGCAARSVKVASRPTYSTEMGEFEILRDQLWWSAREWFRAGNAMIPDNEQLVQELLTPTYEVVRGKIKVMAKKDMKEALGRSPDFADSLVLTFAGAGLPNASDLVGFA